MSPNLIQIFVRANAWVRTEKGSQPVQNTVDHVVSDEPLNYLSSSKATVSNALPSSISNDAPPPVDTWLTRSA